MILPEFILPSRQNKIWTESGMDSLDKCVDKRHFINYPYPVIYHYNSRGFRDKEWPDSIEELQNSVWCLGDSFTVGLGSPVTHTWSNILQTKINKRCINISMDGASNKWIARKAIDILKTVRPKLIVIQWSYINRDESNDTKLSDENRRIPDVSNQIHYNQLIINTCKIISEVERNKNNSKIIHSFIPTAWCFESHLAAVWNDVKGADWPPFPKNYHEFNCLKKNIINELTSFFNLYELLSSYYSIVDKITYIPEITRLDLARDGFHYDIITATNFVEQLEDLIVDLRLL